MPSTRHIFALVTFTKPTWCMLCKKIILGLMHQGFECKMCKYQCHKKCVGKVQDNCGDVLPNLAGSQHVKQKAAAPEEPESITGLTKMLANVVVQGCITNNQKHDMFLDAIKNGNKELATFMIDRYIEGNSPEINMQDSLGNTALHYMAMGDFESDLIMHAMRCSAIQCDIPNNDGTTPLHYLCQMFPTVDCVEIGEMLIARGADVNRLNINLEAPLHKAVFNNRVRFLLSEMLIKHHADLNMVNKFGQTPLHYAVHLNREDLVAYFLVEGALTEFEGLNDKKTPLQLAQQCRHEGVIQLMTRANEVTNFLKNLDLVIYRKKFLEAEMLCEGVLSRIDNHFLDSIGVEDACHRAVLLQNRVSRRPQITTSSGRELFRSIKVMTSSSSNINRGDNWVIQHDEIEFIKKLGNGASGTVYRALFLGTEVAIKVLKKEAAAEVNEFLKEFMVMWNLKSPSIISLFGAVLEPKVCLVMELAELGSLYDVLQNPNITITWTKVFDFAIQAAQGMQFLHSLSPPLLHRDFKTLNLMVTKNFDIKVGDFGLSCFAMSTSTEEKDNKDSAAGTMAYLAPEIYEGDKYTTKADVYSYGIVLWELVNRLIKGEYEKPFEEYQFKVDIQIVYQASTKQLRPTIPPSCPKDFVDVITACWDPSPTKRPDFPQIIEMVKSVMDVYLKHRMAWDTLLISGNEES